MFRCIKCKADDGRPVFRTTPKGEMPGWTCADCLDSPPDPDTRELVDTIDEPRRLAAQGEGEE